MNIEEVTEFMDICMILQCCIWENPKDEDRRLKASAIALLKRINHQNNRSILINITLMRRGRHKFVKEIIQRARSCVRSPIEV